MKAQFVKIDIDIEGHQYLEILKSLTVTYTLVIIVVTSIMFLYYCVYFGTLTIVQVT